MEKLGPGEPERIGAYRLLARLGAGGMGQVYLARSDRGRTVAVKLVRRELAAQEEFRARFRREVRAARRVGGAWTAPVLDADTEAAVPWVATGYVAGPSLEQVVSRDHGPLPERSVRILAAGLAQALTDIHAAGIVHRDLKPSNVLITIDGPRVIDFGIARALETVTDGGLTRTGALVGSPGFMAPEQVRGDRLTPACDVFCLGSVLAYAVTGLLPFGGADSGVHALMFRIAQGDPDLGTVPGGLLELVEDCLRKDPAARPSLAEILERTGAEDTLADGRSREPWLPGALVAQLGRHAVRLLETEAPEGRGGSGGPGGPAGVSGPAGPGGPEGWGAYRGGGPVPSPEHAPTADEGAAPDRPGDSTPTDRLPTIVVGPGATAAPPPPPARQPAAYGHPHPAAYGYPHAPQHAYGSTPPYGQHPPYGQTTPYSPPPPGPTVTAPYGPPEEPPRRSRRTTALLVAVALVVALAAGGSVYALMSRGDDQATATADTTQSATTDPTPTRTSPPPSDSASPSAAADDEGAVPTAYLGTWTATIDNEAGAHPRRLTLGQGEVGDTVLSLVADGPMEGGGSYHCVFEAALTEAPDDDGPLSVGPSTVTVGEPATACSPGEATEVTLLPDGGLERVNTSTGERLTYRKR
ncbi:serine/threonine-protein kinase [Streptomyces sp. NPDC006997]|uniref:serine/threonine-protein kinase n=1 Tax=Streptomyces sp. NPDC006997 TaxID=3155356 RepID=UPI00340B5E42